MPKLISHALYQSSVAILSMALRMQLCRTQGLRLHLDGARIFNAVVASRSGGPGVTPYGPQDVGPLFDSISVCMSKGLGCPAGSLLLGE
jgi:threonine aldolase